MKTKNKILDQLIKSVITITILLTISLLILITLYDFEFTYQNVSNALFIPNIIIFIISALFTLVGTIGRGDLSGRGLWGMVISAIVYAIVLYAPVILQAFVSFMVS